MPEPIYLDHAATSPVLPEVVEAMRDCYATAYANPASQHAPGRRARAMLEDARDGIGELLAAHVATTAADRIIFTSGGTESNHLALRGLGKRGRGSFLAISAVEHPSVVGAAESLQSDGGKLARISVDSDGVVRLDQFEALLQQQPQIVSVMLGNNETGVLQPIHEIVRACRAHDGGPLVHTDATQAVGKIEVNFGGLGVDALTCAAHKFHGPRGVGVLVVRHGIPLAPLFPGGFQQAGMRPGTEPVALAVGMHRALLAWRGEADARQTRLTAMRDRLEALLQAGRPELVVHGQNAPRMPHISNVSFVGLDRQALVMALDLAGVACSTGSACASGSAEPSPVLLAMGCREELVKSSIRLSVGATGTMAEIDEAGQRILEVCQRIAHSA